MNKIIKYTSIVTVLVLLGIFFMVGQPTHESDSSETVMVSEQVSSEEEKETCEQEAADQSQEIYVYVCGAVKKPGVYKLAPNSRICDGIAAAGGLKKRASETQVNQAEVLTDGEQVYIPYQEKGKTTDQDVSVCSDEQSDSGDKINLNSATVEELKQLSGIGDAKAESIIQYREEHGSFSSVEEIKNISGIKDGVFSKIEAYITV